MDIDKLDEYYASQIQQIVNSKPDVEHEDAHKHRVVDQIIIGLLYQIGMKNTAIKFEYMEKYY